jgi:acyl carrier protein
MNDATLPPAVSIQRPVTPQSLRPVIESIESGAAFEDLERGLPFRDAGFDSLDLFNFVLAIESASGLTIPDEDMPELKDLPALARYLDRRLS